MSSEARLREAEGRLLDSLALEVEESWVELPASGIRLRVWSVGEGPEILALHGVSQTAAILLPLAQRLPGFRLHLVDLPGHGLSGPFDFTVGEARAQATTIVDQLLDALAPDTPTVLGHSLGGMLALWHATARPGRIGRLVLVGEPAVALPGVRIRMPLSVMSVPVLGPLALASPAPRPVFRSLLARGLGGQGAEPVSPEMIEVLRIAPRRRGNAKTIASLMHALNHFRRPRPENVLTDAEIARLAPPALFVWGRGDPFLAPADARPSVEKMPRAELVEVEGGHAPWLEDAATCAAPILRFLA
jgi:pimeloyl-ACP methyl ester carboxylesterase